jgi:hypothetical protein
MGKQSAVACVVWVKFDIVCVQGDEDDALALGPEPFDLLLGSDIMYNPPHYKTLADTIARLTAVGSEVLWVTRDGSPDDGIGWPGEVFYDRVKSHGFKYAHKQPCDSSHICLSILTDCLRLQIGRYHGDTRRRAGAGSSAAAVRRRAEREGGAVRGADDTGEYGSPSCCLRERHGCQTLDQRAVIKEGGL